MGQTLVGQHNSSGQEVLNMPTLALVVEPVAEDSGGLGDDRSRYHKRQCHHPPPCPRRQNQPGPRVACGVPTRQITTVEFTTTAQAITGHAHGLRLGRKLSRRSWVR
jgi:hypothetical protein